MSEHATPSAQTQGLRRTLRARHLTMIAIGGSIGTGLFVAFGCLGIKLGQNYQAFTSNTVGWPAVIATYVGIPVFFLIWLGYRLVRGGGIVRYQDMHFPRPSVTRDPLAGQDAGPELPALGTGLVGKH